MADSTRGFAGMDVITINAAVRPGVKPDLDGLFRTVGEWFAAQGIAVEASEVCRKPWTAPRQATHS